MNQKRYSESFKAKVIEEVEKGKWDSATSAAKGYNIRPATITRWLEQRGKGHLVNRSVYVDTSDEKSELQKLREEVKMLKRALKDQSVDYWIEHATVSVLCEELGISREDVKKNVGLKLPMQP